MPAKLDYHASPAADPPMSDPTDTPQESAFFSASTENHALLISHEKDLLRYAQHLLGRSKGAPVGGGFTRSRGAFAGATDVVQDTFARFWAQPAETRERLCNSEKPGPLEQPRIHNSTTPRPPHDRLRAWLFTVCRNRVFDVCRKERRMTPLSAALAESQAHPTPGPAHLAEHRDTHADVLRRLAALPAQQQEVVRLKFQADLSYKQIAEVTGLTVSHVGVLLHQALKTLRQQMNPTH